MVSDILADECPVCVEYVPYGLDEEILPLGEVNELLVG